MTSNLSQEDIERLETLLHGESKKPPTGPNVFRIIKITLFFIFLGLVIYGGIKLYSIIKDYFNKHPIYKTCCDTLTRQQLVDLASRGELTTACTPLCPHDRQRSCITDIDFRPIIGTGPIKYNPPYMEYDYVACDGTIERDSSGHPIGIVPRTIV